MKNAACSSQNRRKLQQRMVASEMAIYASPSDQFNSRSNRTMIGRCGSWTRTQQGENMPILFKTQVNRTAKMPIPARRARVGGLCGFRSPAERVPTGSLKIGRCAGVRECWRKMLILARTAVGKAACDKRGNTPKRAKSRDFGRRRESRTKPRGRARPLAVTSARSAGSFGYLRGRSKSSEKQP